MSVKQNRIDQNHVTRAARLNWPGVDSIPQTNDRDALGESDADAHLFEVAWKMLGMLVYWGHVTVKFSDPEWAEEVRYIVNNLTAVLAEEA